MTMTQTWVLLVLLVLLAVQQPLGARCHLDLGGRPVMVAPPMGGT